jgi:WD40 repeat protein
VTASKGLYGAGGVQPVLCCAYVFKERVFVTGSQTGELMQWTGRNLTKSYKKHTDALWAIKSIKNDSMLMTGGNDGIIYFWDKTF